MIFFNLIQKGGDKNYFPAIEKAIFFFEDALKFPKRKRIFLDITFVNSPKLIERDTHGLCELKNNIDDHDYILNILIRRDLSLSDKLLTIAHEMAHVKQYVTGQVTDKSGREVWKNDNKNYEGIEYHSLPWEKDAFKKEKKLYNKLMETHKIWGTRLLERK